MNSGDLSHRIEVQAITKVPDGGGGFVNSWVALPGGPGFASIWPLKSEESLEGGRTIAAITHRVRIRYRRVFKSSWRIKDLFTGRYYSIITAPIDIGDNHQYLEMLCKEVTA